MTSDRQAWLKRGRFLAVVTVAYNILEGVVATVFGVRADSVALTGFGVDSFVEVSSAVVIAWRLHAELRDDGVATDERAERVERRAALATGVLLLLLAAYLAVYAGRALLGYEAPPSPSRLGIALTAVSAILMPLLARAKLATAAVLQSRALRADAFETIACVWLSITTLAGLALNAAFGFWWADPAAALVLVPLVAKEGMEAVRGEDCCGDDDVCEGD